MLKCPKCFKSDSTVLQAYNNKQDCTSCGLSYAIAEEIVMARAIYVREQLIERHVALLIQFDNIRQNLNRDKRRNNNVRL